MDINESAMDLFRQLDKKNSLKQDIYQKTHQLFDTFATVAENLATMFEQSPYAAEKKTTFISRRLGEFSFELRFGGDVLLFMMHTNIFEFSRYHEVMQTPYILEDKERSYCGMINIYNFLADSFRYNRINDSGYLIGRLFINKDLCYFIEGKRELGFLYTTFGKTKISEGTIMQIIQSAMLYTLKFDLLIPPYDDVKEVRVGDILSTLSNVHLATAKRMGYKFSADHD